MGIRKTLVFAICFGIITFSIFTLLGGLEREATFKDKIIRFHVLANSDAPHDQELKLKVRDRILKEMKFDTLDIEEARRFIKENLEEIERTAKEEIKAMGYDYDVKAMLKEHLFPTKNYGAITFPAGSYEALRVVIGEGKGENWWCVLFPPLCFIDVETGLTDSEKLAGLQGVLDEEELKEISTVIEEGKPTFKLKSKIAEIIEKSRTRLATRGY